MALPVERFMDIGVETGEFVFSGHGLSSLPQFSHKQKSHFLDAISIDISSNEFSEVSSDLCRPPNLDNLKASHNRIKSVSSKITNLSNLTFLDLSKNLLSVVPPALCQLPALQSLILAHNRLASLPHEIAQLGSTLQVLDICSNEILHLTDQIGRLTALQVLLLRKNQISALPNEIANLTQLRRLDCHGNRLSTLPVRLRELERCLEQLDVLGNPLTLPPLHICERGLLHIFKHLSLEALREERQKGLLTDAELHRSFRHRRPDYDRNTPEIVYSSDRAKLGIDSGYATTVVSAESGEAVGTTGTTPPEGVTPTSLAAPLMANGNAPAPNNQSPSAPEPAHSRQQSCDSMRPAAAAFTTQTSTPDLLISPPLHRTALFDGVSAPLSNPICSVASSQIDLVSEMKQAFSTFSQKSPGFTGSSKFLPAKPPLANIQQQQQTNNDDDPLPPPPPPQYSSVVSTVPAEFRYNTRNSLPNAQNPSSQQKQLTLNKQLIGSAETSSSSTCIFNRPEFKVFPEQQSSAAVVRNSKPPAYPGNSQSVLHVSPQTHPISVTTAGDIRSASAKASPRSYRSNLNDLPRYQSPSCSPRQKHITASTSGQSQETFSSAFNGKKQTQNSSLNSRIRPEESHVSDAADKDGFPPPPPVDLLISAGAFQSERGVSNAQLHERSLLISHLKRTIEFRLEMQLPVDLISALRDGVVLCYFINHIQPRTITSIHVPSPDTLQLPANKCRKNIQSFIESCSSLSGFQKLCSVEDILGENGEDGLARLAFSIYRLTETLDCPTQSVV